MVIEIGTIIFGALPIVGVWKIYFDENMPNAKRQSGSVCKIYGFGKCHQAQNSLRRN